MKDVIVVAGATHYEHLMSEYEQTLRDAEVPFHFETVEPMADGPNSMTMRRKISFVRAMAEQFSEYDRVVISDAFDVLFVGRREELALKLPDYVVVSAERNCYPEPHLSPRFSSPGPWRYVNAGLMSGSPDRLISWCDRIAAMTEIDILDQAWLNRRASEHSDLFVLDEITAAFYTVSTHEDGKLKFRDGRPWNSMFDTEPNFFHFSGRCSPESFRNSLVKCGQLG